MKKSGSENEMNGNVKEGKWKIGIAFLLAVLVPVPMVGAQAEAGIEGLKGINLFMLIGYEGINETAFWAFVTIALTVVVSVIITKKGKRKNG